jgi:hypothetical protein
MNELNFSYKIRILSMPQLQTSLLALGCSMARFILKIYNCEAKFWTPYTPSQPFSHETNKIPLKTLMYRTAAPTRRWSRISTKGSPRRVETGTAKTVPLFVPTNRKR